MLQFLTPMDGAGAPPPHARLIGIPAAASAPAAASIPDGGGHGVRLTPDQFSVLYQEHHRALWCIAAAIVRDGEQAYDVVQEAATVALGKLNEFDAATSFPAWCGQIVRFVALNHRKRNARSRVRGVDPETLSTAASPGPGLPEDGSAVPDPGFSARLHEALDMLDDTARACLLMKTVMEMSYRHIAEALGVPEGTAMSHVHRSRQVLRRQLNPRGDEGGDA